MYAVELPLVAIVKIIRYAADRAMSAILSFGLVNKQWCFATATVLNERVSAHGKMRGIGGRRVILSAMQMESVIRYHQNIEPVPNLYAIMNKFVPRKCCYCQEVAHGGAMLGYKTLGKCDSYICLQCGIAMASGKPVPNDPVDGVMCCHRRCSCGKSSRSIGVGGRIMKCTMCKIWIKSECCAIQEERVHESNCKAATGEICKKCYDSMSVQISSSTTVCACRAKACSCGQPTRGKCVKCQANMCKTKECMVASGHHLHGTRIVCGAETGDLCRCAAVGCAGVCGKCKVLCYMKDCNAILCCGARKRYVRGGGSIAV